MEKPKPSLERLSALAVAVLEEAAIEARHAPIKRTVAHRLALGWLAYVGISEPWRTEAFWKLLGSADGLDKPQGQYCRDGEFARCLNGWRRMAGLPSKSDWYR
jgi:hypothetical protein